MWREACRGEATGSFASAFRSFGNWEFSTESGHVRWILKNKGILESVWYAAPVEDGQYSGSLASHSTRLAYVFSLQSFRKLP